MKDALNKHNSYFVRKQYYPHNMNAWEEEQREIEMEYRIKIKQLTNKEKSLRKDHDKQDEILLAAENLLKLKNTNLRKRKSAKRNLRRSERIATLPEQHYA